LSADSRPEVRAAGLAGVSQRCTASRRSGRSPRECLEAEEAQVLTRDTSSQDGTARLWLAKRLGRTHCVTLIGHTDVVSLAAAEACRTDNVCGRSPAVPSGTGTLL
jgi:hypothetical protein